MKIKNEIRNANNGLLEDEEPDIFGFTVPVWNNPVDGSVKYGMTATTDESDDHD